MYTSFDGMLTRAREEGLIDWRKIADHTRNTIVPPGEFYEDTEEFIQSFKYNISSWWERYQVGLWENQNCLVKAFVEKDALCQVVADAALDYQVCVIPGRGYNSVTQLMKLAEELENIDKTIIILYFGDFDPTGLDIDRSAAERLARYSQADIKLKRIALTESDIAGLPHNPTKSTDTRAPSYIEKYGERCWELDALKVDDL
jgi:5S rRNA maturation endonuclease (ribonuclease M5)